MATRHNETSVGTSATAIEGTQYPGWILWNKSVNIVYLGDSGVTTGDGFQIEAGAYFAPPEVTYRQLRGKVEDRLYGVAGSASDVVVLVAGRIV